MRPQGVPGRARAVAGNSGYTGRVKADIGVDGVMKPVIRAGFQAATSNPCELDKPEYPVYSSYTPDLLPGGSSIGHKGRCRMISIDSGPFDPLSGIK